MNPPFDLTTLAAETAAALPSVATAQPPIEFFNPSQLRAYRPPPGAVLVGQNHVVRGATFVIGGAPGVGKSRAGTALAVAGATGEPWFGLGVPSPFRTLIVQNENGRLRLSDEFFALPCEKLDAWVRISSPPPYGLALRHVDFRQMLAAEIASFKPDVVLIDPWNAVAPDDKARDYLDTFELLRGLIPANDDSPALGIIAHTRKPKHDERASGRGLLNLLAGSYVLASVPRSVFVLQPATDAPDDNRVVFTCCKNNDGDMGTPSAWIRRNGLFAHVPEFDWDDFHTPSAGRAMITATDVAEALAHGLRAVAKSDAVQFLMDTTGCEKSAAYNALKLTGRFKAQLRPEGKAGALRWTGTPDAT
jgi:hypothetical protein